MTETTKPGDVRVGVGLLGDRVVATHLAGRTGRPRNLPWEIHYAVGERPTLARILADLDKELEQKSE